LTALTCAGLLCLGCSDSARKSDRSLSSGTGAITSNQVIGAAAAGQLPGLPGLSGLADVAKLDGPTVDIVSPARAAVLPAGTVQVEAVVTPNQFQPSDIAEVHVQGLSTPVDAQGVVRATVQLQPGINTILVEAWDKKQRKTERHVSVLSGDLAPEGDALASTSSFRMTEDALDLLEPTIDQGIEAQRQALTAQVMGTNMGKDTKVKGFRYGQAKAQVDAVPGGLNFVIDVPNVELDFEVKVKFLLFFSTTKRGTIRAQNLRITGSSQIALDANGNVTSQVTGVSSDVQGFSVPSFADKYKNDIRRAFVDGFKTQGQQQLDAAFQAAVTATPTAGTVSQTVLGQQIQTDYVLTDLRFDDWGVTTVFGGNVINQAPVPGITLDRSLVTRTPVADLIGAGPGWNGAIALHQDAMNRALHAAWRGGALQMTLDSNTFTQLGVAGPNSSNLLSSAPGLSAMLPANLPISMTVNGELPPVVQVRPGAPHLLDVRLGALRVSSQITDPGTGAVTSLGDAYYAVEAQVNVTTQNGQLKLVPTGPVKVRVDLVGQALPGTEALLTQVADAMGSPLVNAAIANAPGFPVPAINGYKLDGLQFLAHQESIVAAGNVSPAPAGGTP
jgi:hypothetical protein